MNVLRSLRSILRLPRHVAVVPEDRRLADLRRLGISEAMVRLSSGKVVHDALRPWQARASFAATGLPLY